MKRLLVNCKIENPYNCTQHTDVCVIVEVDDKETDIAVPLQKTLIDLNYEVYSDLDWFKKNTSFKTQPF